MSLREWRFDRPWIWFGIALLILMAGRLVGPRIADDSQYDKCVVNIHLHGPFGLSLNCDSPEFMRLAMQPSGLLEPKNTRQARPGLIIVAAAVAMPLTPIAPLAQKLVERAQRADIAPERIDNALSNFLPAFAAYILLNVVLLLISFALYRRIVDSGQADFDAATGLAVAAVAVLLIANFPVNRFIWNPHTQMFNTLIPLLGVFLALRSFDGGMGSRAFAVGAGLLVGLGNAAYGYFIVLVPCIVLPALLHLLLDRAADRKAILINFAIFAGLSAAPYAAWYWFVKLKTGDFYYHEMTFVQHTWIKRTLAEGIPQFLERLRLFLIEMTESTWEEGKPLVVMLAWILAVAIFTGKFGRLRRVLPVLLAALLVGAISFVFYVMVGLGGPRLAYSVVVPFMALGGALAFQLAKELSPPQRRVLAAGCVAIAVVQLALATILY